MTHTELIQVAIRWAREVRRCKVILTERGGHGGERADVLAWAGLYGGMPDCVLIEVKISLRDFEDDRCKPWRKDPVRDDTALGGERWYFAPVGIIPVAAVPDPWGLVEFNGAVCRVMRKPRKIPQVYRRREILILARELQRYQLHGITYPPLDTRPLSERRHAAAERDHEVHEARQLMGLEART